MLLRCCLCLCVFQAFATDSADQSPWIYYRWLLGNSLAHVEQAQQQQQQQQQEAVEEAKLVLGEVCMWAWGPSRRVHAMRLRCNWLIQIVTRVCL